MDTIFKKRKINAEIVEIPKNKIYTTINTILYTTLKMLSSLLNSFHETLGQYGSFIVLTVVSIFIANVVAQLLEFKERVKISQLVEKLMVGRDNNNDNNNNNNLDKNHVSSNSLIPMYIITGFLGSGKTTLLNNILKSPDHNKKFAVIVNEVGSVSIDHTLIEQNMGVVDDGIIVMKNGCMCCVSSGTSGGIKGTSRILEQLVRIRDSGIAELDGVFVELSGLADPSPTILTFLSEEFSRSNFYLDGIICLIDSSNFINDLNTKVVEVETQLSYSTLIVMNKIDLLFANSNDDISTKENECLESIQSINSLAPIVKSTYSKISLDNILCQKSFDQSVFKNSMDTHTTHTHDDNHHHDHDHDHDINDHDHHHHHHEHTNSIKSICVSSNKPLNRKLLYTWLHNILEAKARDIYRVKGIVFMEDDLEYPIVIQGVHAVLKTNRLFDVRREGAYEDIISSNIVFIGKNLNDNLLQEQFLSCCS